MPLNIAFIGFGEVGQLFARQLKQRSGVGIAVYDLKFDDSELGPRLMGLAETIGARPASSSADACRGADIVISAVTAIRPTRRRSPPLPIFGMARSMSTSIPSRRRPNAGSPPRSVRATRTSSNSR